MPRNKLSWFQRSRRFVLQLLISILFIHSSLLVYAAPPIDEIRSIIVQKALRPQSSESLASLDSKRLETGLQAIDQYARYVPSPSLSSHSSQTKHLGIEIFVQNSRVWIRPEQGGPADNAKIPEIGELQSVNGKKLSGLRLDQISIMLDNAVKSDDVFLTVSTRPGGKGRAYRVNPAAFRGSSFTWRREGNKFVMRISEFVTHETAPGFSARFTALVRSGKRVVLDLRGCSGGDLYEALEIAGIFVAAGHPLVSTYDRTGTVQTYRSPSGKKQRSPSLVLIDRRTASAAEILAGILQYHRLARVVGEPSYGKCVSQTFVPLSDGGGLWLTTLGVLFPDNTSCAERGIKPDIHYPDISISKISDILYKFYNLR